jgi:hypothetical protein
MAWGISGSLPFLVLMQHFERVPKSQLMLVVAMRQSRFFFVIK